VGQIVREFVLAGFAVLAGLSFGSFIARLWKLVAGSSSNSLELYSSVMALGGAICWLLLFKAWRRRIDNWAMIGAVIAFVGCASLTGIGGIVDGQTV
jgi:hypothetical protein